MMRIRATAVLMAAATIGAAGCGSSSSSSSKTSAATPAASGPPAPSRVYTVQLTGANEVPNGSPTGSGTAKITVNGPKLRICWQFHVTGIAPPSVAHIHAAGAGVAGPILVPLGGAYAPSGCVNSVPKPEIEMIVRAPRKFYVNVHNMKYPNGALRAQL